MTTWHATNVDGSAALWTTDDPGEVLDRIRHQRGPGVTVANHDYDTWAELTLAGQRVPHPAVHYHFPGPFTPRENQRATMQFFATHHRSICLNGMRTGKTLSALWAADFLQAQDVIGQVLIVCPKSTMETVWERTLLTVFGGAKKWKILTGTAERKIEDCQRPYDFLIVNPESLHIIMNHVKPSLVVVDEATSVKNPMARRWKALHKVVGEDLPLWLLTATPTQHSPEDALGLVRLLHRKFISAQHWRGLTMLKINKFKWIPREDAEQTVAKWLHPAIRYTLADCGDVPQIQKEFIEVKQTKQQRDLAEKLKAEAVAELEGEKITAANAGALLSKLLQIDAGIVYHDRDGTRVEKHIKADPFYEAVEEFINEADTPVVVFAPFRSVASSLAKRLKLPLIWGDTPMSERTTVIDDFQAGLIKGLVAVPDTMSHGITLSRSSYVLWVLPTFKAETYAQANGRVLEAGSNKNIVIAHIVCSPIAKRRYTALESKERLQDTVLDLLQGDNP